MYPDVIETKTQDASIANNQEKVDQSLLGTTRHGRTRILCAILGNYSVELVKIGIKVENFCSVKNACQRQAVTLGSESNLLLTATHSMISTYFGSITIVLKFPLTSAASAKGEHR